MIPQPMLRLLPSALRKRWGFDETEIAFARAASSALATSRSWTRRASERIDCL